MMVSIKSSSTVKPNKPTPNVKFWLPESDQSKPYTHAPIFFIYRPLLAAINSDSPPSQTLKNSLSEILVSYYPLAGRLKWIDGGRFELHSNAAGAEFFEAESESKIDDLGDFPAISETKKLLPPVDYTKDITESPLLLVQLTKFRCGGIGIGMRVSHAVADGTGTFRFVISWGDITRGKKIESIPKPFHDRTVFYRGDPSAKPRFNHVEHKPHPLLIGKTDVKEQQMKETTTVVLKLSKNQVDILHKLANEGRDQNRSIRKYTRFEAMSGHIWRCVSIARKLRNEQLTSLRITVDCRNRLQPPLPLGYYGNAVMITTAVMEVVELMKGLGHACGKIRENVEKVTDEYIRSATDFLSSRKDITPYRSAFHSVNITEGLFLGNPNLTITSWFHLPIYDSDFGWGKPIFMGPAELGFDGRTFIIPGPDEEGSAVVPIRLQVEYIKDFEKKFYEIFIESIIAKL